MDQTQDLSGQQLYRINQLYQPPEFVKQASTTAICGTDLPAHLYLDEVNQRFPCHTKAATWVSAAFYYSNQANFTSYEQARINDKLVKVANVFNISNYIADLQELIKQAKQDVTVDDSDYALIIDNDKLYPLRNPSEVIKAAQYLQSYRERLPYKYRCQFANNVVTKAAQLGIKFSGSTHDLLQRLTGQGYCTSKQAAELIVGRVRASHNGGPYNELQQQLLELAKNLTTKTAAIHQTHTKHQLGEIIDNWDRLNNIKPSALLKLPEDVLFQETSTKLAGVVQDHVALSNGAIYQLAALETLPLAELRNLLGRDLAQEFTQDGLHVNAEKLASVLPQLSPQLANLFTQLASEQSIKPVASEDSTYALKLSADYLQSLAGAAV